MKRTARVHDQKKPLMSIILQNHNHEKYLEQCFHSILNQTYDNIEISFYDCASTDNSWEIAMRYQKDNPGIINLLHLRKNYYPEKVIDHLQNIRGKYLMRFRTCNALRPNLIEMAIEALEKNPSAAFVMCNKTICDDNGIETRQAPLYNESCIVPGMEHILIHLLTNPPINDTLSIYNTDRLKTNECKEAYLSELYLCLDYNMIYLMEPLLLFREYKPPLYPGETKWLNDLSRCFLYTSDFIKHCFSIYDRHDVVDELQNILMRLGRIAIRRCIGALIDHNETAAKKLFYLSASIDLNMEHDAIFLKLQKYWKGNKNTRQAIMDELKSLDEPMERKTAFSPPKGSRLLS